MNHVTWIEINKSALEHNIQQYRQWLPEKTNIAAVIKSNAYGHGLSEIGKLHEQNSLITRLCVANSQEGVTLRLNGITKPILVLGYINTPIEAIVQYNLDVLASDFSLMTHLHTIGQKFNKKINIHLKIDTGLSRLGFIPTAMPEVLNALKLLPFLHLQGICSHLIEAFNQDLIHEQEELLKSCWTPKTQIHISKSNGSLLTKYVYDFARIGIGLYGYFPEANEETQSLLQPILSLKTKIFNIKKIPTGTSVGYGKTYVATKPTVLATLAIGYYEGIDPDLSNFGKVLIHGEFAPIVGRVNMNYTIVDITHIPQTQLYDTATVLGTDKDKKLSAYDWRIGAKKNVRIFLARLNENLPKLVIDQPNIYTLNNISCKQTTIENNFSNIQQ